MTTPSDVIDFVSQVIEFPIGRAIPGGAGLLKHPLSEQAFEEGVLVKQDHAVTCDKHQRACKVRWEGDTLIAYHAEEGGCRFEIDETETYQFIIDYRKLFLWLATQGLQLECREEGVRNDNHVVWGHTESEFGALNLYLLPRLKEDAIGRLFKLLFEQEPPKTSLLVFADPVQQEWTGGIVLLTHGFAVYSRLRDLRDENYRRGMLSETGFVVTVERSLADLQELAVGQIEFGLDPDDYSNEFVTAARLQESFRTQDWAEFESLSRYAVSRLMPMALSGYGKGDYGRLPDSLGVIPNESGVPELATLFDAKSIKQFAKAAFLFGTDDSHKYADYIRTAEILRKRVRFEVCTLLFVAPEYSPENLEHFLRNLRDEALNREVTLPFGVILLELGALVVLFRALSDPAQQVVLKSKDPTGEFERTLFNPRRLLDLLQKQGHETPHQARIAPLQGVIVDEQVVASLLGAFLGGEERFSHYFEEYRKLAHEGER